MISCTEFIPAYSELFHYLDETFGLLETVEKAAQLYMLTAHLPRLYTITDPQLLQIAKAYHVEDICRKDFLDL